MPAEVVALPYVYATDMHGATRLYRSVMALAERLQAGALILGGDLLPHARTPGEQAHYVRMELCALLSAFRRAAGIPVYVIQGNDDFAAAWSVMDELEADGLIHQLHGRRVQLPGGWDVIGYGHVPPTPFYMKDFDRRDRAGDQPPEAGRIAWISRNGQREAVEVARYLRALPSIEEELAALPPPAEPERTIYVIHTPPYNTRLDRLQTGTPVGSRAVRAYLEKVQPRLSLHGHIHEGPRTGGSFWDRLGRTICVNPGSGQPAHAVYFDPALLPDSMEHTIMRRSRLN